MGISGSQVPTSPLIHSWFQEPKPKLSIINIYRGYRSTNVRHRNRIGPGRDRREDRVILYDIDELRARRTDSRAAGGARGGPGKRDAPEVRKRHEPVGCAEVLHDPLRVVLAQRGLARERVRDRLARRLVRNLRCTACG